MLASAARAEASYDKLSHELVAPCCWKEALAAHRSPAADAARTELHGLIAEGKSESEIRDWFVDKYGERILLTPQGDKAQALFWTPVVAAAIGLLAAAFLLRRWVAGRTARLASPGPAPVLHIDDSDWDW
ncbi:MAG: cytochrome c-type biogenesis protein CcmH [Bryobacterales bacterium]